jgi:peroxiredoxin
MLRIIFCLALVAAAAITTVSQNNLKIGSAAPQFSATAIDGRTYDLAAMRGQVVVITFWSTRCMICQAELPRLDRMMSRYDASKVKFLALTSEDESRVRYYLSLNPVASTVLPNSFGTLLQYADRDQSGNVNIAYPAYFIIDREGKIQYRNSGYDKTGALSSTVDRLLSK